MESLWANYRVKLTRRAFRSAAMVLNTLWPDTCHDTASGRYGAGIQLGALPLHSYHLVELWSASVYTLHVTRVPPAGFPINARTLISLAADNKLGHARPARVLNVAHQQCVSIWRTLKVLHDRLSSFVFAVCPRTPTGHHTYLQVYQLLKHNEELLTSLVFYKVDQRTQVIKK